MEERQAGGPETKNTPAIDQRCSQLLLNAPTIPVAIDRTGEKIDHPKPSGQAGDTDRALEAELASHLEEALSLCMKYIRDRFPF